MYIHKKPTRGDEKKAIEILKIAPETGELLTRLFRAEIIGTI